MLNWYLASLCKALLEKTLQPADGKAKPHAKGRPTKASKAAPPAQPIPIMDDAEDDVTAECAEPLAKKAKTGQSSA